MDIFKLNLALPILLFLFTLALGFWLSRLEKPLNILVFTLHKLIALATVILTGKTIYNWFTGMELQTPIILLTILIGVCALALFITGAFLSRGKVVNQMQLTVHKIAPVLISISAGFIIYLLAG